MSTEAKSKPCTPSALRLLSLSPTPTSTSAPLLFPAFLKSLTSTLPPDTLTSYAGYTSHPPLQLRTRYYASDVTIWCDEIPFTTPDAPPPPSVPAPAPSEGNAPHSTAQPSTGTPKLTQWRDEMLSSSAHEVRLAIGAIILLLPLERQTVATVAETFLPLLSAVNDVREAVEDDSAGREVGCVVVLQLQSKLTEREVEVVVEKVEDAMMGEGCVGWDVVAWDGLESEDCGGGDSKNVFGEKMGLERIREVLEGVDWAAMPEGGDGGSQGGVLAFDDEEVEQQHDGEEDAGFDMKRMGMDPINEQYAEFQREMMSVKLSMLEDEMGESEHDVEDFRIGQLPGLVDRVMAIREAGSELSRPDRERFARREVERLMKDIG